MAAIVDIARQANEVFDQFVKASEAGDQARMGRLVRQQFDLVKQQREHAQADGNSVAETVALHSLEIRALHMQTRALSDRLAVVEDHLTRPEGN